jgi:endonuclease-3
VHGRARQLITPVLFGKYPTVGALADAEESDIGEIIYSCGFYKTKSHDIKEMCRILRTNTAGSCRIPWRN